MCFYEKMNSRIKLVFGLKVVVIGRERRWVQCEPVTLETSNYDFGARKEKQNTNG